MQRVTITNRGLSLLASSSEATGQYYWLGYYALAYVPSIWKNEEVEFPSNGQECLNVNGEQNIESTDTDQISPAMTRLTKYGDMIYNIWQGSSAKTATGNPEEPTSFYTDIKRFYRYVLDENGNNTLVAWTDVGDRDGNNNPIYIGKHVYRGTDGYTKSTMYIPAPLYYLGDTYGKLSTSNYFKELPSFEETSGTTGNGSDIYPYMEVTLDDGSTTLTVPEVTTDYRAYRDSAGTESSYDTYNVPSQYFNSKGILPEVTGSLDSTSWVAAKWTLTPDFDPSGDFSVVCSEFWKLWSISNYNRYNAPAGSIGASMSSEFNTRNFSKLTKFFPIESYNVVSSERGISASGGNVEVATALKLGISINLSSRMENDARQYDRSGMSEQHPSVLVDGTETPKDENGKNIFESTHVSFKFNRIGIYAVPVMKAPVVNGKGSGEIAGKNVTLQYQIDPDGEPVLFAVIDWDNTITLSDTGDGIHEFEAEFNVNLEAPDGSVDSSLVRDTSIFYNIYQTPELKWYQNQLIATASTANAITELGLELAAMRTRMDALNTVCCALPEKSDGGNNGNVGSGYGLRNLKDASTAIDGGLRGVDTIEEIGDYKLGIDSIALGTDTGAAGKASSVLGGENNIIDSGSDYSAIVNGNDNTVSNQSTSSVIAGGEKCVINDSKTSAIIGSCWSSIKHSNPSDPSLYGCGIFSSHLSDIESSTLSVIIGGGSAFGETQPGNHIGGGIRRVIIGGTYNIINGGNGNETDDHSHRIIDDNIIVGGHSNTIYNNNNCAAIISGRENTMNGTSHSTMVGGKSNTIPGGIYNAIISGEDNTVRGVHSSVFGGEHNVATSDHTAIISGGNNTVSSGFGYSIIAGGYQNVVQNDEGYNGIFSGYGNWITRGGSAGTTTFSSIFGGFGNVLRGASYSSIVSGKNNYIGFSDLESSIGCAVIGGESNYIYEGKYSFVGSSINARAFGDHITILGSSDDSESSPAKPLKVFGHHLSILGSTAVFVATQSSDPIHHESVLGSTDVSIYRSRGSVFGSSNVVINGGYGTVMGSTDVDVSGDSSAVIVSTTATSTGNYSAIIASTNADVSGDFVTVLGSSDNGTQLSVSGNYSTILGSTNVSATGSMSTVIGSSNVTTSGPQSIVIGSSGVTANGNRSIVIGATDVTTTDNEIAYATGVSPAIFSMKHANSSIYIFNGVGNVSYSTANRYNYADLDLKFKTPQGIYGNDAIIDLEPNSAYSCIATFTSIYSANRGDGIGTHLSKNVYHIAQNPSETPSCYIISDQCNAVAYTKIFAFTIVTNADGRITMTCSDTGNPLFRDRNVYGANETFSLGDNLNGYKAYTATRGSLIYAGCSGWTPGECEDSSVANWEKDIYVYAGLANGDDSAIGFKARVYLPDTAGSVGNRHVSGRVKLECEKITASAAQGP